MSLAFNPTDLRFLAKRAQEIRKVFLKMHYQAHSGHIGSGLSCIDFLTYVYFRWKSDTNAFLLSKGHAASALYATLYSCGLLTENELNSYYKDGTLFPAHPVPGASPSIIMAAGSLGHGLSISVGLSYVKKYFDQNGDVSCLLSDGECNEGAVWEAAQFASQHQLNNLKIFIDANGIQGFGKTSEVLAIEPLVEKWKAFGFEAREINGHDFSEIANAIETPSHLPVCIVGRTTKGKGVSFMEDRIEWHYLPMNESQYNKAILEIETQNCEA